MEQLIHLAKQGNPDAFTQLLQSQMQNMYKTAAAILFNDADAADAVQETILICWEKIGQLKNEKYFKTWLMRILINECRKIIRNRKNLDDMEPYEDRLESTGDTPEKKSGMERSLSFCG